MRTTTTGERNYKWNKLLDTIQESKARLSKHTFSLTPDNPLSNLDFIGLTAIHPHVRAILQYYLNNYEVTVEDFLVMAVKALYLSDQHNYQALTGYPNVNL